jgi:hypothetical protein
MSPEKQRIAIAERFMAKVEKTPTCWLWKGAKGGSGYGQFWNGERTITAHHFLLPEPVPVGCEACHKCDVKLCVNPDHIFIGTRSDNMRDMVQKKRHNPEAKAAGCRAMHKVRRLRLGSQNHEAVLNEETVAMIRSLPRRRGLGAVLARQYRVSESLVSGILSGKRWKHVAISPTAAQRAEAFLRTIGKWEEGKCE